MTSGTILAEVCKTHVFNQQKHEKISYGIQFTYSKAKKYDKRNQSSCIMIYDP